MIVLWSEPRNCRIIVRLPIRALLLVQTGAVATLSNTSNVGDGKIGLGLLSLGGRAAQIDRVTGENL